ncbi:MAG: hypothetical protein GF418_11980 [Chitinivibrionales bacterium]|nr:hypothetical protein [Chitinivibrionales bacterium]MBD3396336.1 hypothetical protein [Chitinivibrionales bacterium]
MSGSLQLRPVLSTAVLAMLCGCAAPGPPPGRIPLADKASTAERALPQRLPFSFTRKDTGDSVSPEETEAFTRRLISFCQRSGFFTWILETSHGMDSSANPNEFMVRWDNFEVIKNGGQVMFRALGHKTPDNIMIPTSKILGQAAAGYLLTGDTTLGRIVEQYSLGVCAQFQAMTWDKSDTAGPIMARAVMPANHTVVLPDGRTKHIDYSPWQRETRAWNTRTFQVPENPFWPGVWVKNMRSKDDLPHLFRAAVWLAYVTREAPDERVRDTASRALACISRFCADIVANRYQIRTRDKKGNIFIPENDLASFVAWDAVSPKGECTAKLTVSLLAYGSRLHNRCRTGFGTVYGTIAPKIHYFNLAIIRGFHMSAILNALITGRSRTARMLTRGLAMRAENVSLIDGKHYDQDSRQWEADGAVLLLQAATCGLPLTSREVRLIHRMYGEALDTLEAWPWYDVWDPAVPDGTYPYRPEPIIATEDLGFFLEYCFSPFVNTMGPECVDCELLRNGWDRE